MWRGAARVSMRLRRNGTKVQELTSCFRIFASQQLDGLRFFTDGRHSCVHTPTCARVSIAEYLSGRRNRD